VCVQWPCAGMQLLAMLICWCSDSQAGGSEMARCTAVDRFTKHLLTLHVLMLAVLMLQVR
jgi:hypothetical protein